MTFFAWLWTPISGGELWCRLPLVDRDTRNLSLTRCAAVVALACWCHVAEHAHTFSWASVAILGIITVMMMAKKIEDLRTGFGAVGGMFRRRSSDGQPDRARRLDEVEGPDIHAKPETD